jgi:hypothetical protein
MGGSEKNAIDCWRAKYSDIGIRSTMPATSISIRSRSYKEIFLRWIKRLQEKLCARPNLRLWWIAWVNAAAGNTTLVIAANIVRAAPS